MQISEKTIFLLLQKDDIRGLEHLFNIYYRSLVLWVDTFINDIPFSEDLVQDFFIKMWEKKLYRKLLPGKAKGFLYTSLHHLALNALQKKDLLKQAYRLELFDRKWEDFDDQKETLLNEVEKEIEKLPHRSREVVVAVYLKGMRYRQIADILGISEATVKTLLVLSLKRLRRNLSPGKFILFLFISGERGAVSFKSNLCDW